MTTAEKLASVRWDPHAVTDTDCADLFWEEMLSRLEELMASVQRRAGGACSQYIDTWFVEGGNLGWRRLSGAKVLCATEPDELLRKILPDTECTFATYDEGVYLKIVNYHHDAPTGESYRVHPLVRIEEGIRAEVQKMGTFKVLRELMRAGNNPTALRHADRRQWEEFLVEDRTEELIAEWKVRFC